LHKNPLGVEIVEEATRGRSCINSWGQVVGRKAHRGGRIDLVLEGTLTRVLGLGIHQLKFYKKRRVLMGFPLNRRGFGLGLLPISCVLLSHCSLLFW